MSYPLYFQFHDRHHFLTLAFSGCLSWFLPTEYDSHHGEEDSSCCYSHTTIWLKNSFPTLLQTYCVDKTRVITRIKVIYAL